MATKTMPGKLLLVVVLMSIGVLINFVTGAIVSGVINGALVLGVLAGNDGVRQFLRGLAVIQILWAVIALAAVWSKVDSQVLAVAAIFAIGMPAWMIWTLGQDDVREWMFRKNFHIDDTNDPPAPSL